MPMNRDDQPLVSVLMITFNHENYIRQAVESVLAQQAGFPYELVIADDCSTDQTAAIAAEYERQNPDRVRLLRRHRNLGATRNFVDALRQCRGRFVAILEGDDYWIVPDKLARQADLLLSHPECSICFTRTRVTYETGDCEPWDYPMWEQIYYTAKDLLKENFVPNCTAVFRQGLLLEIPEWFYHLSFADWGLHLLLATLGDLVFLPETTAVYRVHGKGIWSGLEPETRAIRLEEVRVKLQEYFPELAEAHA
jgi:glycosyltransferase involved in cell wall biosynthesis